MFGRSGPTKIVFEVEGFIDSRFLILELMLLSEVPVKARRGMPRNNTIL